MRLADFSMGLTEVAADWAAVTRTDAMTKTGDPPYPGIRPFRPKDSSRFFGREAEAATLAELWRANSLTIAVGPTGSGKTSLLQAGLLPLVEGGRAEVLSQGRISYGSKFPAAGLPEHNPYTLAVLGSWSPGESATRLVGMTVQDFIGKRAERHDGAILAVIDQMEDLFAGTGPRRSYQRQFLGELAEAVRDSPRLHLLLSIREAALDEFSRGLGGGARLRVTPLSFESALRAVTGPARGTHRSFGPGAAEEIVNDLRTSYLGAAENSGWSVVADTVQPSLLQVACARLWSSLPSDLTTISGRDVRRYGGVSAALAAHCGRVIATVAEDHDLSAARLRSWLNRTFVTEPGTLGTAYEGATETAGMPNAVARAFEDRHLLTAERRSGSRWYGLLSERLIEPLRRAPEKRPLPVGPADYLRAAERASTLGEFALSGRYAEDTLRTARGRNLQLQAEAESLLGNIAHERGRPAEAEGHYRVAATLFDAARDTTAVAHQLAAVGQTLLAQGRLSGAVEELNAAVGRLPNDLVVQAELGWALWQLGEGRAAVAVFTGVLATDGGNVEALRGRGEILAELSDFQGALRDLDRVAATGRPSTRAARGLALSQLGAYAEGAKELAAALADAPRNGTVLLYAAQAEALSGDLPAAADLADRAVNAADPPLPPHQREAARQLAARREGFG
jgi:tetratricopeptide (TPR) repeat protein